MSHQHTLLTEVLLGLFHAARLNLRLRFDGWPLKKNLQFFLGLRVNEHNGECVELFGKA